MQRHTYTPSSDIQSSVRNPETQKVINTEDLFVPYLTTKPDHLNSFGGKTWPTTDWKLLIVFIFLRIPLYFTVKDADV